MSGYNLERLNFLIIDDNKHMRALIKTILHALGSKNVHEAMDGADAFKELRHFPADIIICDWNMSPLDGMDFVRLVRTGKDSPNPFVPIIMLTGHTEMNRVMEARDAGVHEFMAKPISAKGLYARIRSIIEKSRSFVRAGMYFGPDRRRRNMKYQGADRRKEDKGMVAAPSLKEEDSDKDKDKDKDEDGLSQAEVEALLK